MKQLVMMMGACLGLMAALVTIQAPDQNHIYLSETNLSQSQIEKLQQVRHEASLIRKIYPNAKISVVVNGERALLTRNDRLLRSDALQEHGLSATIAQQRRTVTHVRDLVRVSVIDRVVALQSNIVKSVGSFAELISLMIFANEFI